RQRPGHAGQDAGRRCRGLDHSRGRPGSRRRREKVIADELQALIEDATYDHVTGESAAALEKLGRATSQHPDSAEAWHAVAEISLGLRRLDEALAAAERAHALRKSDPL